MSKSRQIREHPDVAKTMKVLQEITGMRGVLPVLNSETTESLEIYGCLDGKTYALAMMRMYGATSASQFEFWKADFPADVYADWEVLAEAFSRPNPAAHVFENGGPAAKKLALIAFIDDVDLGRIKAMTPDWTGIDPRNDVMANMSAMNRKAVAAKAWRGLPHELIDGYISASESLCNQLPAHAAELRATVAELKKQVLADRVPKPEDIPSKIDPDSKYARMKGDAKKRFKL